MFLEVDQTTSSSAANKLRNKKAEKNCFYPLLQESLLYYKTTDNKIPCTDALINQQIRPEIRSKMACWMIEVFAKCGSGFNTFFLAMHIMESYLKNGPQNLEAHNIHIIGIVSMFVASKFEDVTPISMNAMVRYIAHGKYTENQIIELELNIVAVLEFNFKICFSCDYLGLITAILHPHLAVCRTAEVVLVLIKLEYNCCYPPCEEAAAALVMSAWSLNQYKIAEKVYEICEFSQDHLNFYLVSIKKYIDGLKVVPRFVSAMKDIGVSLESAGSSKIFKFDNPSLEAEQEELMSLVNRRFMSL